MEWNYYREQNHLFSCFEIQLLALTLAFIFYSVQRKSHIYVPSTQSPISHFVTSYTQRVQNMSILTLENRYQQRKDLKFECFCGQKKFPA